MTVSQIIDLVAASELKNLYVGDASDAANVTATIGYINLGITELYKRFELNSAEAIITMRDSIALYSFTGTDANVAMPGGAFMSLRKVVDQEGNDIPINDNYVENSVFTPSYYQLQVPNPVEGEKLSVLYKTEPAFLTSTTEEVNLPAYLLEALLHYIGYRAHASLNGNIDGENNTHYTRFNVSCDNVLSLGLAPIDQYERPDVADKGFI